ncbi:TetR/AcrR family transcriptional regulator [Variovorax sp. V59]|jgi:AcrR family transcriptional regulator|uniref:AcrR family transcriptional regulator n=2 Tax=Variovorax TaxID=34072 RepID=A0AAE3Y0G0_VARPD|nr:MULTISPECIES: TetR/AcrR family transcriptional regulator [Variovorax]MBD9662386.1 TetR/AcrR family transcriptional regulator [Variovorax sp. VRV01]MDP9966832.1 AcrR family transcriptional regulator [Variovorax paradoxus]MDR6426881.1 AcrR family transcriptional regulator [Variovorax paradoxus]MDR6450788.1 AcrR family transcriptional regulator [Variovorax paradoxus]TWD91222.1 TetR family transcriptional regulator [Variovorax beijingensis]
MNDVVLPNKRPGGRSAQVQALVRTALEELVAEQGRERVTVPAVAERAGVSASSIYRRWGDLSGLLAETAAHRLDPNRPLPDTGSLRQDLTAWAQELITHLARPCNTSLLKAAAALADGGADTDCLRNRRKEALKLVEQAHARGERAPEAQQVIDHLIAPIVFRLVFGGDPVKPALAKRLVDELFVLSSS